MQVGIKNNLTTLLYIVLLSINNLQNMFIQFYDIYVPQSVPLEVRQHI